MFGIAMGAALGAAGWTLAEYLMHRYVGHEAKGKNSFSRKHLRHHAEVDWFAATWEKAVTAVVVVVPLSLVGAWLLGAAGIAFAVGFTGMYVAYEVLHRLIHVRAPTTAYGRWACRHHLHHHFKSPRMNHGVTTPLWDHVFGTYEAVAQVRIPPKHRHRITWLVDAAGEVRDAHRATYAIGGRGAA